MFCVGDLVKRMRSGSSIAARLEKRKICKNFAFAFISIFILTVPSSVALAFDFKTVCREPVPDKGPPRTLLPLDGTLCKPGSGGGDQRCPPQTAGTDNVEIINILDGDQIVFEFVKTTTGAARVINTVKIGDGTFQNILPEISFTDDGTATYTVVASDQTLMNGIKFQLAIDPPFFRRQTRMGLYG